MTELIIACHGQSQTRRGNTILGWWTDVPLSQRGQRQALLLADGLRSEHDVSALYTSPLRRAAETAHIIADLVKVVPRIDADLRELDSGPLKNLTYEEAARRFPNLVSNNGEAAQDGKYGLESYASLRHRVVAALDRIVDQNEDGRVVVVTHGGPVVSCLRHILCNGGSLDNAPYFECAPASRHILRFQEDGVTVVALNDQSHLVHDED